jgi:DNA repair protein RecO (recombination protein O)
MSIICDQAYVLRSFDFRETSRIATLFTRHHGKIKGIFKGIRAGKKNFTTTLDIGTRNEVMAYPSHNELWLVSYADMADAVVPGLMNDLEKNAGVHYMMELTDTLMPLHAACEEVFDVIARTYAYLTTQPLGNLIYVFQAKLLELSGFRPALHECVHCRAQVREGMSFSVRLGGMLCVSCRRCDTDARLLSGDLIVSLQYIQQQGVDMAMRLKPSARTRRDMCEILDEFLAYHVNTRMKSMMCASV